MPHTKDNRAPGTLGRRQFDKLMEERINTLGLNFDQHLIECTEARRENSKSLEEIKIHLQEQDKDLSEIRALKRTITMMMGAMGTIAALLEVIRFFSGH